MSLYKYEATVFKSALFMLNPGLTVNSDFCLYSCLLVFETPTPFHE